MEEVNLDWYYSPKHGEWVIDVVIFDTYHLTYLPAATRVADALTQDLSGCGDAQAGVLLAPIESSVIPLLHQIRALSRTISCQMMLLRKGGCP